MRSESIVARERAGQVELLRRLDFGRVAIADGSRTMVEWVAFRLDVSYPVARDLMFLAKAADSRVEELLAEGRIGLERAVLMTRLRLTGASESELAAFLGFDLAGLERLVAARKRIAATDETATFGTGFWWCKAVPDIGCNPTTSATGHKAATTTRPTLR